jgi:hypothetical protein
MMTFILYKYYTMFMLCMRSSFFPQCNYSQKSLTKVHFSKWVDLISDFPRIQHCVYDGIYLIQLSYNVILRLRLLLFTQCNYPFTKITHNILSLSKWMDLMSGSPYIQICVYDEIYDLNWKFAKTFLFTQINQTEYIFEIYYNFVSK